MDAVMFLTWEEHLLRRAGLWPLDDESEGEMLPLGDVAREIEAQEAEPMRLVGDPVPAGDLASGTLFRPWVWDFGPGAGTRAHREAYGDVVLRWDQQKGAIVHAHPTTREVGSTRAWVTNKTFVVMVLS